MFAKNFSRLFANTFSSKAIEHVWKQFLRNANDPTPQERLIKFITKELIRVGQYCSHKINNIVKEVRLNERCE